MAESTHTEWYVKTEGGSEGPFLPQELVQQACTGKILGDSELSASPRGPWLKAESLDALELEWQVQPEEGDPFPRCHALALRKWVEDEVAQPYWDILHVPTGENYDVVDALCSALLAQNHLLEDQLSSSHSSADEEELPLSSHEELRIDLDRVKKEAAKWKRLYDDEITRNETREQELLQENETLRAWQRKAAERIKALERRQSSYKESQLLTDAVENATGDRDLESAYEELKLQMSHLLDSLQLKSRQLDEIRDEARELKIKLRSERKLAEEKVDHVSELHEDTLDQLNQIEQAHVHLTRSFRELNDKLIRFRNQSPKAAPAPSAPAPTKLPPKKAEKAEKREKSPPPPPENPGGPVKIKMT